ncbi:MAG: FAD-dependent thymidylate synthase, partial [Clostridia bacterium]|nr:FAD-dependent thymidylate synthase [Clostridia bacterium]
MNVTLIAHTPDPEKVVAAAAKLCYSSSDVQTLMDNLTPEKVESFVQMLASYGHESPVEHVTFTFGIEGVSRSCTHQLVRHRIASYSQKSQRYVSEKGFEYVTPPEIAADADALACYDRAMEQASEAYNELADRLEARHYETLIAAGKDPKAAASAARKMAIEDARFVLPNACETKIIVTMNARTLLNFFHHRCCNRAQWEIRAVAQEMLALCREVAPTLFSKAGPSCLNGPCPEGTMTCGKIAEMRARYAPKASL